MDDLFEMTTDINDKPIPRWQARLDWLYFTDAPFGEILSLVRALIDDRAIDTILRMSDEAILNDSRARGEDPEQVAAEMRQKFDAITRLVKEKEHLQYIIREAQPVVCGRLCPSVKKVDEEWKHCKLCSVMKEKGSL